MIDLDSPRWSEPEDAYGAATDIPKLLRQLDSLPTAEGDNEPWFSIWSRLAHQGDVYSASFAAVPHVIRALETDPVAAHSTYFQFPAWVEICRQKNSLAVPPDLAGPYSDALAKLPSLVAAAAARPWDADLLVCALAAVAAAKGFPSVAEAVQELDPETASEFLDWSSRR